MAQQGKFNSYSKIAEPEGFSDPMEHSMSARTALAQWVISHVNEWEEYRDTNFLERWKEYYRLWRGIWAIEDKTRDSERSRLISPALQQAVESATAELEEATFSKHAWFDLDDDLMDQNPQDMVKVRESLLEDFKMHGVNEAISEVFLNAALYGTGIGKIVVEAFTEQHVETREGEQPNTLEDGVAEKTSIAVKLEPILPENFVIDTTVTRSGKEGIEQALGCACVHLVPRHIVEAKQNDDDPDNDIPSTYYKVSLGSAPEPDDVSGKGEASHPKEDDAVEIIEYYGKVPRQLLELSENEDSMAPTELDEMDLVEAYITVGNRSVLLRGYENPNIMKDRPIVAYAYDVVPNRFWGRGIAEKAYNPQKALDGLLRAQMDGLALTVHPMLAIDATRIPRGMQMGVRPGKTILTNGNPNEVLKEFRFGSIDPLSYSSTGDLERMIQMATGAMDSASPLRTNRRNETASGMSMIMGNTLKRTKRILQNIERNFLDPLIKKALYRYMQFLPERYPAADYKFVVRGTLGMMAKEIEQAQLTNLLQYIPPETPAFFVILKGIIDASSVENKDEIKAVIDQMMQPNPQQQQLQQYQQQTAIERDQLEKAEIRSRIDRNYAKIEQDDDKQSTDAKIKTLQLLNKGGNSKK